MKVESAINLKGMVFTVGTTPNEIMFKKGEQFKDEMANQALFMSKIENLYLEKTKMTIDEIRDMLKHDLWLDSETCLKLGLVDEVI